LAEMGAADIFARPAVRAFLLDIATNPASRPFVHVSRLEVGDTCAAANLGLQFRGRYYHVLASRCSGELARFGPGAAHLRALLRHAIEADLREFDFTVGDEAYKRDWAHLSVPLFDHTAASTERGLMVIWWVRVMHRLKRVIKQ